MIRERRGRQAPSVIGQLNPSRKAPEPVLPICVEVDLPDLELLLFGVADVVEPKQDTHHLLGIELDGVIWGRGEEREAMPGMSATC